MAAPDDVSPHALDPPRGLAAPGALGALFALIALLVAADLITDLRARTTLAHVLLELIVIVIGGAAAIGIAMRLRRARADAQALRARAAALAASLRESRAEAARWRQEAGGLIAGLGAAIDAQLARWSLTPAEREVALLLLKGLSHKEIAEVRGVSETTVRQQARALYRKAGLSGRNDLAAFFLEDLLGPRDAGRPGARDPSGQGGIARVEDGGARGAGVRRGA